MWTPKRIVLLVAGFALFFTGYFTYSYVLGGIDGLPPLPRELLEKIETSNLQPPKQRRPAEVEKKLQQAFGADCPEAKRPIKIDLSRNNMVLASDSFKFDEKGRLVLTPFSVAMFGKPKNEARDVEINTISATVAYLTFDKPISSVNPNELNGRKIVGAELMGNIEVINNRRTSNRNDDLELFIKTGPLYYEENRHLIWTYDEIHVTDRQSQPKPNEVHGKGMEMELQVETPTAAAPGRKSHQDSITGVKRITLQSDVTMDLYIDGRSSFMNQSDKNAGAKKADGVKPATVVKQPEDAGEKAHLNITTPGRFEYLFFKDHDTAHFEVLPGGQPTLPGRGPRDVIVRRHNEKLGTVDQLYCQNLDLLLVRNEPKTPVPGQAPPPAASEQRELGQNITVESVHATATTGKVTLISDTEKLAVTDVIDLMHDAKKGLTVLKGNPRLVADKEGNKLYTSELTIEEIKLPGGEKAYQKTTASGPGQIDFFDKKTGKMLQHAFWNDRLISTKDERTLTAKGDLQDLLILLGNARFLDDEHAQTLHAESIKVWLLSPSEKKPVEKATPAVTNALDAAGGSRVDHLEALQNVTSNSRELNVHDTGRLVVWFKDAPPSELPSMADLDALNRGALPPVGTLPILPPDVPKELPKGPAQVGTPKPAPVQVNKVPVLDAAPTPRLTSPAPTKPEEPARPVDLSARSVEAWVQRSETKNTLEKLWTEGNVHVKQPSAKPGEQGVDILGETLNMIYHPEGNLLTVTGNDENLAQLQMDKILVLGPEVNIDQVQNKVWVEGAGAMRIDSNTTLSGQPLEESVPLTIQWHKSMFIQGRYAEFNVGIQATQKQAKMACNTLRVNFDQPISLKEGNRGEKPPKVQTLLCDERARVEDVFYEGEKLMKYQRLESPFIEFEALEPEEGARKDKDDAGNQMRAKGPGRLRIGQRGGANPLLPAAPNGQIAAKPGVKPANDDQLKLTLTEFSGSMYANSKTNFASFRKDVRVLHMPVENAFMEVDIDVVLAKLPEGAMYLSCHHLEVYTRAEKGKNYQEMHAREQAVVQSREFWGRAASIHFDEFKDQVIFDGGPGVKAELFKSKVPGQEPEHIRGDKIIYNRTTGKFTGINIESLQAN